MRNSVSEKLEIIRLVKRSDLPAQQALDMLGIVRTTFYRWYAHYRCHGKTALQDKAPLPARIWNLIPDTVRERSITLALDRPERVLDSLKSDDLGVEVVEIEWHEADVPSLETWHCPIDRPTDRNRVQYQLGAAKGCAAIRPNGRIVALPEDLKNARSILRPNDFHTLNVYVLLASRSQSGG